jgi:hypothetical protein
MVKIQKIKSSIKTYTLHERFTNFVSTSSFITSATTSIYEVEDKQIEAPKSPERLLFIAVIYQALLDATKDMDYYDNHDTINHERNEARRWFTVEYGTTATDFEEVCHLAGIDPKATRSFVKKIFNKEINFERKRINVLINGKD